MPIQSVNHILLVAFTALSLLVAVCSLLAWQQHVTLENAQRQQTEVIELTQHVTDGTGTLSRLARAYAATGHPRYKEDYAHERSLDRMAERALTDLRALPLEPAELAALGTLYDGVDRVRAVSDLTIETVSQPKDNGSTPPDTAIVVLRPHPQALAVAYGDGMEDALHRTALAARAFRRQVEDRLILESQAAQHHEALLEIILSAVWTMSALMIALVVFFYYRRKVLEPIQTLISELATPDSTAAVPLSNLSLRNEVGQMIRVVSRAQESVAQMELLRRIKTATAEITLAAHQATSLPGIAQTLSVHLSQRLNHAVVVVHLRPTRKAPLELYSGRMYNDGEQAVLAVMVRDRAQASAVTPTDPGLVLECERSQKILQVNGLPPSYLWLNSGTGKSRPRYLTLAPIVFDRKTLGVVEIASLSPLESQCLHLVRETCDGMALLLDRAIPHGLHPEKPIESPASAPALAALPLPAPFPPEDKP